MFADTAVHTADRNADHTAAHNGVPCDAVYAKTATGRDEVIQRRMGLSRRQRSVLILLDGQRSCAALAAMMPHGQVADIVAALLALDLIAPCAVPVAAVQAAAAPTSAPQSVATTVSATLAPASTAANAGFATLAPASAAAPDDDAVRADEGIAAIQAYMVQAAQTCLGLLAAEVVDRIERAHDAARLRGVVGHWHMALQASKHGRAAAAGHLERVRTDLRRAGIAA